MKRKFLFTVPPYKWKFAVNRDPSRFCRLGKSSMFVATKKLQSLKDGTKDAVEYARKVMFRLLITQDKIVSLAKVKTPGVCFVKLFGSKNWRCLAKKLKFPVESKPHNQKAKMSGIRAVFLGEFTS